MRIKCNQNRLKDGSVQLSVICGHQVWTKTLSPWGHPNHSVGPSSNLEQTFCGEMAKSLGLKSQTALFPVSLERFYQRNSFPLVTEAFYKWISTGSITMCCFETATETFLNRLVQLAEFVFALMSQWRDVITIPDSNITDWFKQIWGLTLDVNLKPDSRYESEVSLDVNLKFYVRIWIQSLTLDMNLKSDSRYESKAWL